MRDPGNEVGDNSVQTEQVKSQTPDFCPGRGTGRWGKGEGWNGTLTTALYWYKPSLQVIRHYIPSIPKQWNVVKQDKLISRIPRTNRFPAKKNHYNYIIQNNNNNKGPKGNMAIYYIQSNSAFAQMAKFLVLSRVGYSNLLAFVGARKTSQSFLQGSYFSKDEVYRTPHYFYYS